MFSRMFCKRICFPTSLKNPIYKFKCPVIYKMYILTHTLWETLSFISSKIPTFHNMSSEFLAVTSSYFIFSPLTILFCHFIHKTLPYIKFIYKTRNYINYSSYLCCLSNALSFIFSFFFFVCRKIE